MPLPTRTGALMCSGRASRRVGSIRLPPPFAPEQLRAFDSSGSLWVALSHEYALFRIGPGGDTLQVVALDLDARPLSAAEADSVNRYIRALHERFRLDVREGLVPRTAPLLKRVTVGDDGSVWVTRADPPSDHPAGTRFDVFDRNGQLMGEIILDFPLHLRLVQDGRMYGVARDELGVERVFAARVARAEPGS